MDKEELEIKKDISKRLSKSDTELWNSIPPDEKDRVVNEYYNINSIDNVGIHKVLEDNRNTRRMYGSILIGLLLGLFGSTAANVLFGYLPEDNKFIDFLVIVFFGSIIWHLIKTIESDSIDHLKEERVLNFLVHGSKPKTSPNIALVLQILKNEAGGDVAAALEKMSSDYSMTWMYQGKDGELFPTTGMDVKAELEEAYPIKGREYDIRNITEGENVVMLEVIESYPDPDTGQLYRTPQIIVLEFEDGKIKTGRHYCDPKLSHLELSKEQINAALRNTETKHLIS